MLRYLSLGAAGEVSPFLQQAFDLPRRAEDPLLRGGGMSLSNAFNSFTASPTQLYLSCKNM